MKTEKSSLKTRKLVVIGMFCALAFVGSYLKIPSPFGTTALDSAPAFLAALLLGPIPGAMVAFLGHLLTSLNVGFPLSLPLHLLIAFEMAIICAIIGLLMRKGYLKMALLAGLLLNGVAAPATFIFIPQFGMAFFTVMLIPLLISTTINLLVAWLLVRSLKGRITFGN